MVGIFHLTWEISTGIALSTRARYLLFKDGLGTEVSMATRPWSCRRVRLRQGAG